MKPSDVQDDLVPGIAARRDGAQLGGTRRTASYAVARMGLLKRRLGVRSPEACEAGGDHRWRGAEKPAAELAPWPPGRWERCAGCRAYRVAP